LSIPLANQLTIGIGRHGVMGLDRYHYPAPTRPRV